MRVAAFSGVFDNKIIDGFVDGLAKTIRGVGRRLRFVQRGEMQQNLAFAFGAAAILIIAVLLFFRSNNNPVKPKFPAPASHAPTTQVEVSTTAPHTPNLTPNLTPNPDPLPHSGNGTTSQS
jgi:hypothetical protein